MEKLEQEIITDIPVSSISLRKNNPIPITSEELRELTDSIKLNGVVEPIIVRPTSDNNYEVVCGQRRLMASEKSNLITIPAIIRNLTDDQATIMMIDSILFQRKEILPSQKARLYKLKLDTLKHQGKATSRQVDEKLYSVDELKKESPDSARQIHRYIRLLNLNDSLLKMTDNGNLKFNIAVEISHLSPSEQDWLLDLIEKEDTVPSLKQAEFIKKLSNEKKLTYEALDSIMSTHKATPIKITFTEDKIKKFFPQNYTAREMEKTIIKLLENWQKKREQQEHTR